VLTGHKRRTIETTPDWRYVLIDDYVRVDPNNFFKASIHQMHNGVGLYIPSTALLQVVGLKAHLWTLRDPSAKLFICGWIKKTNPHFGRVAGQAQEKQF